MNFDLKDYRAKLSELRSNKLSFGNSFLDAAAGGILFNDLIILAATSGAGKTEQGSGIALHNAMQGKKVTLVALEGFKYEIQMRNVFRLATDAYYKNNSEYLFFNFQHYLDGEIPEKVKTYIEDAENQIRVLSKNFKIIYREKDYTIEDFEKNLTQLDFDTDLVIIDHLHFFDYEERSEYMALNKIVKKIRDLVQISEIPIILVSQLNPNKVKNQGAKKIIASQDDLHGSSNIQKVSSKIITIAPDFNRKTDKNYLFPTWFRVAKNRYNGSVTRYCASMDYDIRNNTYCQKYFLGKLNFEETKCEYLKSYFPSWSKNHISRKGGNYAGL